MGIEETTLMRVAARTEKGTRENNEDCFCINDMYPPNAGSVSEGNALVCTLSDKLMCGVFDGMGGRAFGEEASFSAASKVSDTYSSTKGLNLNADMVMESCMRAGNRAVLDKSEEFGGCKIGTTGVLLYVDKNLAFASNMGDSRVYMYRDQALCLLSHDDNQRQKFIDAGMVPPKHSECHLTSYMGMEDRRTGDYYQADPVALRGGERFLLCSDGLSSFLSESRITEILSSSETPDKAVDILVNEAMESSNDNITAVVVYVESVESPLTGSDECLIMKYAVTI